MCISHVHTSPAAWPTPARLGEDGVGLDAVKVEPDFRQDVQPGDFCWEFGGWNPWVYRLEMYDVYIYIYIHIYIMYICLNNMYIDIIKL